MIAMTLDTRELERVGRRFGLSKKQLRAAYWKAATRTITTMLARARKDLRIELGLRSAKPLKKRLRTGRNRARGANGFGESYLWIGTNDMKAGDFKGRVAATATGVSVAGRDIPGAFLARVGGRRQAMMRVGRKRFPVMQPRIAIHADAAALLGGDFFRDAQTVFQTNFAREVRARTLYKVGRT